MFGCQKWFPDFGCFQLKFCVHFLFPYACYMSQQFNYPDNNTKCAPSVVLGCAAVPILLTSVFSCKYSPECRIVEHSQTVNIEAFWFVTLCGWDCSSWCFEVLYCLHFQGEAVQGEMWFCVCVCGDTNPDPPEWLCCVLDCLTLKMKALWPFRTSWAILPMT